MECVKSLEFIDNFDDSFEIDTLTIKPYGLVLRYSRDGKPINVDVNESIENGEWALWNDLYDVVTLHRVNKATIEDTQAYGSKHGNRTKYEVDLLMWAKANKISQLELYDFAASYLYDKGAKIISADFDIANIEKREFIANTLSVDSILLMVKYNVIVNKNYCITNCNFKKC